MTESPLQRVRAVCLALPEVTERPSHGTPTWFVQDKKTFVSFHDGHGHASDGRPAIWVAAPPGAQTAYLADDADRFFRPKYVGHRGWVGVHLDRKPNWKEIAAIVEDAYRAVAPRKLIAQLD